MRQDKRMNGCTALMRASKAGHMEFVKELLDKGAEVNIQDKDGWTALMRASKAGQLECVKVLLDKGAEVNMQSWWRETALMMASKEGHMECVKVLLDQGADVNIQDKDGWTALMRASKAGQLECVKVLLDKGAEVNMQSGWRETALMMASKEGHMECVKVLLDQGADVNIQDKEGSTALMRASNAGHMECFKILLDKGADVNIQNDSKGKTALMMALEARHMECVKMLVDKGAKINLQSGSGDTALHLAVRANKVKEKDQISCVRTLLFHPGIDVNLKNNQGRTAIRDAEYGSLSVFKQVLKTCSDFPADSYGKVVLCGNPGAGKSTLTQRVFGQERVVVSRTAGIIPHQVDSPYSNMIIYDLAGQHQFFSSHSACLEAISLNSPAIFLLLQDMRKDSETMAKEVRYWSTMIDNVCYKCPQKSLIIVVGTHADLLKSKQLVKNKESDLEAVFKMAANHQILVAVITVNLTDIYSAKMDQLLALLYSSTKEVLSMSPPISLMCHMMLAFLKERLHMHAILLSDLLICLDTDQDKFINPDITAVVPLLKTLSEKGLIVFIPSADPHSSWVVYDKESILKNVNGALFADPVLKNSTGLASTTGIIPTAALTKAFPDYNCDMITQFMVHFEIGQAVDLSKIKTNMAPEGLTNSDLGPLLFIPALVSIDRPSSATVPNNSFCWSEIVKCTDQFFTPCFHHVLLHRLPLEFALPEAQTTSRHSQPLNRLCDVWSRGIKWLNETGVTTIVEMSESFQAISLTMSSPNKASPKYVELAHSVREVIKKARQEFCPYLEVLEVVTCPPECSSDHSIDTRVDLSRLRKAILENETHIIDVSGNKHVAIDEWKKMEPHLSSLVEACTLTGQVLPPVEDLLIRQDIDQDKFNSPDFTEVVPPLKTLSEKGKISTAVLKKAFPDYNCGMITQFMVHFEIGQVVDLSKIKTNMAPEGSTSSDLGPLLFIPALVSIDRPSSATVPNNSFCWSEIVKSDQFFTPRFHHVLIHWLPLEFALPDSQTSSQPLNRLCDVWSRGIKWLSETGVTTIVEMSESFQAISLTMSSPSKASPKYLKLAHSVLEVIMKTRQEFCPYLQVLEVVSCPPECSSDHSIDTSVELSRLRKIGVNYLMFGMILLQDDNGAIVKALEEEHCGNAEKINTAIFQNGSMERALGLLPGQLW
ncbi:hypothetical protein EMCRGX_G006605 [Ephydatia muelleri]